MKTMIKTLMPVLLFASVVLGMPATASEKAGTSDSVPNDVYAECMKQKNAAEASAFKYKSHLLCLSMSCKSTTNLQDCAKKACNFDLDKLVK
jgi:hypothetical protein